LFCVMIPWFCRDHRKQSDPPASNMSFARILHIDISAPPCFSGSFSCKFLTTFHSLSWRIFHSLLEFL
jgi:hypothetical protein